MRRGIVRLVVILAAVGCGGHGTVALLGPVDAHEHWLRWNARPLKSASDDDGGGDVEAIARLLASSSVVELGVDPKSERARSVAARIVSYAHRKFGFDVVAIPAGLYACEMSVKEAETPVGSRGCEWEGTAKEHSEPGNEPVGASANPLVVAGYEPYLAAAAEPSAKTLGRQIHAAAPNADTHAIASMVRAASKMRNAIGPRAAGERAADRRALDMLVSLVDADDLAFGSDELATARRAAHALSDYEELLWEEQESSTHLAGKRAALRKENIRWIAQRAANGRVIVWSTPVDSLRDTEALDSLGPYRGAALGDALSAHFGPKFASVVVFATSAKRYEGTWEAWAERAVPGGAIINVRERAASTQWLREPFRMHLGRPEPIEAEWVRHLDAIVFVGPG